MTHTFSTQRIAAEKLMPELLQLASCNAFGCCWLFNPVNALMLLASAGAVANQDTATGMTAWLGG